MKTNRLSVLTVSLFLMTGCERVPDKGPALQFDNKNISQVTQRLNENIGWIHGTCLAIRNGKIKTGETIQMIVLSNPQRIIDTKILGVADSNSACSALLSDRAEQNKEDGRFFYSLDVKNETTNVMAIGFVSSAVKPRNGNHLVEFDINNDGKVEHAGMCLTSEGVQFYISSSSAFDDKALWSDYYYLGYDNKPTCP